MIKRIELLNFKGETGDYEFTGRDLFTGPNGSGKTRITEAVEYALTGKIGRFTQNAAIYNEYGSTGNLSVSIHLEDEVITRKIKPKKKKDGSFGYTGEVGVYIDSRMVKSGAKEVDAYLDEYVHPFAFNYRSFLMMNSSDRRKALLELIGYSEPTQEELINSIPADLQSDFDGVDSIDEAIKIATRERTYFNRKQKESSGATAFNTDAKNELDGNIRQINTIEKGLIEHKEQLDKAKEQKIHAESIMKQIQYDNQVKDGLKKKLQNLMALDYESAIRETTEQINQCQPAPLKDSIYEKVREAYDVMTESKKKLSDQKTKISEKRHEVDILNNNLAHLDETITKIQEFDGTCPIAGVNCTSNIEKGLESHLTEREAIIKESDTLLSVTKSYIDEQEDLQKDADEAEKRCDQLTREESGIKTYNMETERMNNQTAERKRVLETKLQAYNKDLASLDSDIKNIRDQIKEHDSKEYEAYEPLDMTLPVIAGLEKNISEANEQISELKKKQQAVALQQKAIKVHESDYETWELWKEACKNLEDLKADKMKEKLTPIAEKVNEILKHAGCEEEFVFILNDANGNDIISFGLSNGERTKVALSSGEQTLVSIGMLKMLQSRYKLSLLFIDEILLLDDDNLDTLMNLPTDFDNVVLLSPRSVAEGLYHTQPI